MSSIPAESRGSTHKARQRTIVDREVQMGIIRKLALHWVAFFLCNAVALLLWTRLFEQPDLAWEEALMNAFRRLLPFFVISAALIPAFVLDTLKMTNRFAGPISRLRSELKNAAEGRPVSELKFRAGDYWAEIAANFNRMADRANLRGKEHHANDASA
ncbi:MAG: hypothetical protein AAGD07_07750 [Planctomycetota bacterium]